MTKRWMVLLLAATVALLAACGSSEEKGSEGSTAAAPATTEAAAPATTEEAAASSEAAPATSEEAASSEAAPATDVVKGGRMKIALEEDFDYWDGASYYGDQWAWNWTMFRPLLTYASTADPVAQNEMVPGVAESYEANADNTVFTFKLRPGLTFPDGSPVTAADVKATYEFLLDPASGFYDGPLGSGYYNTLAGFDEFTATVKEGDETKPDPNRAKEISGIKAVDDLTVEFTTTKPDPAFLRATAMGWAYIRKAGLPHRHLKPEELTTLQAVGPYKFTEYTPKKSVTIDREPTWAANVAAGMPEDAAENNIDGFDIEIGMPSDVQTQNLKDDKIDIGYDGPVGSDIEAVGNDPQYQDRFFSDADAAIDYLVFKTDRPPFDNLALRQAVAHAVDRTALVTILGGEKIKSPWAQTLSSNLLPQDVEQPYDIEAGDAETAQGLVDGSGVAKPIKITLVHFTTDPAPEAAASVKEDLEAIGFEVELKPIDRSAFYGFLSDPKSDYSIALPGWGQDYPDAITYYSPLMTCKATGGGTNYGQFCDEAFDAKVDEINAMPIGPERDAAWAAFSTETATDYLPYTAVMLRRHVSFNSTRVGGYAWTTARHHLWSSFYLKDGA